MISGISSVSMYQLLICEDAGDLEDEVESALENGFVLLGAPFFANGKYHQGVVLPTVRLMQGSQN